MHKRNSDSVYYLINELCESLLKEGTQTEHIHAAAVRKLKSRSFEILLKKSKQYSFKSTEKFDLFRELNIRHFSAKLSSSGCAAKRREFKKIEEHIEFIRNEPFFKEESGQNILQFILALEEEHEEEFCPSDQPKSRLLFPAPFTLHAHHNEYRHYLDCACDESHTTRRFLTSTHSIKDPKNPYLHPSIVQGKPKWKIIGLNTNFPEKEKAENVFTKIASEIVGESPRFHVKAFCLLPCGKTPKAGVPGDDISRLQTESSESLIYDDEKKVLSWNWENIDCYGVPVQKPYACAAQFALDLKAVHEASLGNDFSAKLVTSQHFIRDLKALTIGIQSDIFYHDEHIMFHMIEDITIEDVIPETMENFIHDFIECGTCYKRLQIMTLKKDYKLMFEGFIFKALCDAIDEYLITFRQFVFAVEDERLTPFYRRMRKMMKQISNLSFTLAVHPKVDPNVKHPMGSEFLGYIYKEIMRITEKDAIMLLVYILRKCCNVYFKYLHKWLFYGTLDDASNELFICFADLYRENTKYFYDKAYFVRKDSVPGFFQGYEDQILQCGKYTQLLKSFKPNHPLFQLEYPTMPVCLSFEEIKVLEESCRKYSESAKEICGKPVTIRDVFENQYNARKNYCIIASEKSKINMDRWRDQQRTIAAAAAKQKQKQQAELLLQLQDAQNRKINEKRANIEQELKYLKEARNLEERQLMNENINLKKKIEYYQELSDVVKVESQDKLSTKTSASVQFNTNQVTPRSVPGTDFESCAGDDDAESIYTDCCTTEYSEHVNRSETELNDEMYSTSSNNNESEQLAIFNPQMTTSDRANSNEIPEVEVSDVERIRNKILGGSAMEKCLNETPGYDAITVEPLKRLTQAQQIKLKVLNESCSLNSKPSSDINSNPLIPKPSVQTELQRNRMKMMQNDTFFDYNREKRPVLTLDLTTERARNKMKVLYSEFNILSSLPVQPPPTPMSTTSDSAALPMGSDCDNVSVASEDTEQLDKENANIIEPESENIEIPEIDLKLDVITPNVEEPSTATVWETPECGLNTAGVMARHGFDFKVDRQPPVYEDDAITKDITIGSDTPAPQDPYKRCEDFVNSNFKSQPTYQFFRFDCPHSNISIKKDVHETLERKKNLNSLSVTALTEFLQKSIVLPMHAHLEIMTNEIMRVFLEDLNLLGHFKSLRNYFLLMDGEFGSIICDGIIGRLESHTSPAKLLNYQTLHSILETALGSSIIGNDKNAENLSFIVSDVPEKFDLNAPDVLSTLTLSYRVDWPLNLILNPETLEQYSNIFKYLMKVRRISWILEESHQILKEVVKKSGKTMLQSPQYIHVQQIRHKFFHFIHALKNHITSNALQACWKTFKDELINARSIEDVYRKHTTYIKRILFLCMLNKRSVEFYNTIENIFKISLRFCSNLKSREWKLRTGEKHFTHSRYEKLVSDEAALEKLIKYTIYLGKKIVRHGYQEEIGEFINLINFNQYYIGEA